MERFSLVPTYYTMETQKFDFFSKTSEIRILTCDEELKSP